MGIKKLKKETKAALRALGIKQRKFDHKMQNCGNNKKYPPELKAALAKILKDFKATLKTTKEKNK